MAVTVNQVNTPANGVNPGIFATITQDSVTNNLDVFYFLTTPGGAPNGTIQVDYTANPTNGALTVRDTVFTRPTGAITATYYGDEATNPIFVAYRAVKPDFVPSNPGYAITQYTYTSPGVLAQVIAIDASGKAFVGSGASQI